MILGFAAGELAVFLAISLVLCVVVCSLAMESVVLFVPAFLFLFPGLFASFPALSPNEAIGLAFIVAVFGYSSSVSGYWYRDQIDFSLAARILAVTVPIGVVGRLVSYLVPEEGLLLAFGVLLIGLAVVLYQYHPTSRRTCLLCGDAVVGMGDDDEPDTSPRAGRYTPRTRLLTSASGSPLPSFSWVDRTIVGVGGGFAGLVGVAIGEVSNTFLCVRKRVPVKLSTGTSALVLYVTILSVLATNLLVVAVDPAFVAAESITIPWRIGVLIGFIVIVGGQIGSYLNSRAADRTIVRALLTVYAIVGAFVIARTLLY